MHTTTNKDNTHRFEGLHFHHQQQGKHPQIWRPSLPPPTTRITPIGLKAFTSITNNKEYTHRFEGLHFHHQQQGIHPPDLKGLPFWPACWQRSVSNQMPPPKQAWLCFVSMVDEYRHPAWRMGVSLHEGVWTGMWHISLPNHGLHATRFHHGLTHNHCKKMILT